MLRTMRSTASGSSLLAAATSALLLGCGGPGTVDDPDAGADVDAAVSVDATIPDGYTRLIGRTWSLNAGQADTYRCVRTTVAQDTYITAFAAQAPFGTHHTVLSVRDGQAGTDGEYDCNVNSLDMNMMYASGVATDQLELPAGVGLRVRAGQQINLNLHLFNATEGPISGDSGILVKSQPTPTPILAEMMFAGSISIAVPPGQTRTITGGCTLPAGVNQQLFALWPHMHQYATHQKFEVVKGGVTSVLHDEPYSFFEQTYYRQEPTIALAGGDRIRVACTYTNTSSSTITFGDSSNQEMCFAGMYVYPARGVGILDCTGF